MPLAVHFSEKGQTRTHQVREVHNQVKPDCSCKTDESLGMDLMQKGREGQKECQIGDGYRCQECVDKM